MSGGYAKPSASAGMLRLHLNENTAGCSPRVLDVLQRLTAADAARYPEYEKAIAAVTRHLGVLESQVLLTNGLDEGILAATAAAFRLRDGRIPEAVGVVPAFDMYQVLADGLGGRMVLVPLGDDFTFPAASIAEAVTEATRIVFVTNPHNPTGQWTPVEELRALARRIAPVILFVDEAYAGFAGDTIIRPGLLDELPNVIVGRTFAKADGLAGLRAGALVAGPTVLDAMRRIVPPYSLNAVAAAVLPAALTDDAHRTWYYEQCERSRALLSAACPGLGLRAIPSVTNFMLIDAGARAAGLARALGERGVAVRDRSREKGTPGCLRVTTGVVEDTRRLIAALEDACRDVR